jgi:uncharacterized protein YeaO (DUF488 family)
MRWRPELIGIEKKAYDKPERSDGKRVLVMKIWPRGIRSPVLM